MRDCMCIELEINLGKRELEVLKKEAEAQRAWMKKQGREGNWTEKDELFYAINKRVNELKVKHGEEQYDAEYNRYFDEAVPVAGEIRARM